MMIVSAGFMGIPSVNSAPVDLELNVDSSDADGAKFVASESGFYKISVVGGAYCYMAEDEPEFQGWRTRIELYLNKPVEWGDPGEWGAHPINQDAAIGTVEYYTTYAEAQAAGQGSSATSYLERNDYVIAIVFDGSDYYSDNSGMVKTSIKGPYGSEVEAQQEVVKVENLPFTSKDIHGNAKLIRAGVEEELKIGQTFQTGDVIKTEAGSWVELGFPDGSIVKIDEDCRLKAEEWLAELEEEESTLKTVFDLIIGRIYSFFTGEEPKEIHTSSFAMAVRSTEFTLDVADDGQTTIVVLEGIVECSDLNRTKTVEVGQYQILVMKPGELPSAPTSIDANEIDRWWTSLPKEVTSPALDMPTMLVAAIVIVIVVVAAVGAAIAVRKRKQKPIR
jgi:hypothetical protein